LQIQLTQSAGQRKQILTTISSRGQFFYVWQTTIFFTIKMRRFTHIPGKCYDKSNSSTYRNRKII